MKKIFSLKKVYYVIFFLFVLIFLGTYIVLHTFTSDSRVFLLFAVFTFLLLICMFILFYSIFHELTLFTRELHKTLDSMIEGTYFSPNEKYDETLLSQINHHLGRLYSILENTKNSVNAEKLQLQELISDISHQLKTPMTTLRLTESAMEKAITKPQELQALFHTNTAHLNKLEFLISSLVKISRLEAGIIKLAPSYQSIGDTILMALENVVLSAAQKNNQLPRCKHSSTVLGSYVAAHSTCLSLLLPQARKRGMKVCLSLFYI